MKFLLVMALLSPCTMFAEDSDCTTLEQCQSAIQSNPKSSLAHYRMGEVLFRTGDWYRASLEFLEAQRGDSDPAWIEGWAHISAGMIYDLTNQRPRALNEYQLALATKDNTRGALDLASKYMKSPNTRTKPYNVPNSAASNPTRAEFYSRSVLQ